MQSQSKLFEDFSKLMTNAMGVAQGAKEEFEATFRNWFERLLQEYNVVTRDEFEAVRTMAMNAREENENLRARIEELESAAAVRKPRKAAPKRRTKGKVSKATEDKTPVDPE